LLLLWGVAAALHAGEAVEVRVDGLSGPQLENVLAFLPLEDGKSREDLTPALIERLHNRAEAEIARALEPFGYYRPEIVSELRRPEARGEPWLAVYKVEPQDPLPVTRVDIEILGEGGDDSGLRALVDAFPLRPGDSLNHLTYEEGKRELENEARARGYLDAEITEAVVDVDLDLYQASVRLEMNSGHLYRFGAVSLRQGIADPAYLALFVPFEPGERFSTEGLSKLRRALNRSGYFRQVRIARREAGEDGAILPIDVELEPIKPNRYRAQLGWGTDTGLGAYFDWDRRYLGRKGHSFNLGTALVQERRKLVGDFSYVIPLRPLHNSRLELFARHQGKDLTYTDVDLPEGGETRIVNNRIGAAWYLPLRLLDEGEVEQKVSLAYISETYDVFDVLFGHRDPEVQDIIEQVIGPERRAVLAPDFRVVVPQIGWSYRRADDLLAPRDGEFFSLDLLGASESLGSNVSFWQARARAVLVRPFLEKDRLIFRSDLGYTDAAVKEVFGIQFNQFPESYEFRTGGDRTVRGYKYESLYPLDSVTGGKHLVVASLEYDHHLFQDWSVAAFVDAGNAINDFSSIDLKFGVGAGVRWQSPVGMVRLDLAMPLDEPNDGFRIHLNIGPEF